MNILVPLNNIDHVCDYKEAGAKEFYIGFNDENWKQRFGEYSDINRLSGFHKKANPNTFEELQDIIPFVQRDGAKVYVTFNAAIYAKGQFAYMAHYFERLKECRAAGVIVSTLEQVDLAARIGIPAVASTICGIYNSDIACIYYEHGAKRLILPRDLSTKEIGMIMEKVPDAEYEVFMMRNGCMFSDANCLGFHRIGNCGICTGLSRAEKHFHQEKKTFLERHNMELNNEVYTQNFHQFACGLCALYDFYKMGVSAYKIVGRSDEWENICNDIRLVRQNLDLAAECKSREEYLEKMIFPDDSYVMCKLGLSCYYPEIRF